MFATYIWNLKLELGQVMLSDVKFSEQIIPLNLPTWGITTMYFLT